MRSMLVSGPSVLPGLPLGRDREGEKVKAKLGFILCFLESFFCSDLLVVGFDWIQKKKAGPSFSSGIPISRKMIYRYYKCKKGLSWSLGSLPSIALSIDVKMRE